MGIPRSATTSMTFGRRGARLPEHFSNGPLAYACDDRSPGDGRPCGKPTGRTRPGEKNPRTEPALAETVIAPRSTANLGEEGAVPGRAPSTSAASDQRGARAPSAGGATSTLIGAIPQISRA
jgi:hypothetical protein